MKGFRSRGVGLFFWRSGVRLVIYALNRPYEYRLSFKYSSFETRSEKPILLDQAAISDLSGASMPHTLIQM